MGVGENLQAWVVALLGYPGLLFSVLLVLLGEWLVPSLRPLLTRTRGQRWARPFLYPVNTFFKLSGRQTRSQWTPPLASGALGRAGGQALLGLVCALAPLLALSILPMPGNPVAQAGQAGDLLAIIGLLCVQPIARALARLHAGGLSSLRGAQDLGRLLTGLLPGFIAVAALMEVSRASTLQLAALGAAPETGSQALVRLLAGVTLIFALPWWLDRGDDTAAPQSTGGAYAGRLLETAALAAFWSLLVLPRPGEPVWAFIAYASGSLLAYVAFRFLPGYLLPARREKDAANLVWSTALPLSAVALVVALWSRGL